MLKLNLFPLDNFDFIWFNVGKAYKRKNSVQAPRNKKGAFLLVKRLLKNMSALFWKSSTSNAFSTTLNGAISASVQTVTLNSITGLPTAGGVLVIDRQDGSGNDTPTKREFITYTAISGNDLTGVTRGAAGSTAQSHSSGALVEETFSVTHWNDLYDYLVVSHDSAGKIVASTPTLANARMITSVQASGASLVGSFPLYPVWVLAGPLSGVTTNAGLALAVPRAGNWESFSMTVRTPVSGVSMVVDINKNGTSIFSTIGRPMIGAGGTFVSSASIATKIFAKGDQFTVDLDIAGNNDDLVIQGVGVL